MPTWIISLRKGNPGEVDSLVADVLVPLLTLVTGVVFCVVAFRPTKWSSVWAPARILKSRLGDLAVTRFYICLGLALIALGAVQLWRLKP